MSLSSVSSTIRAYFNDSFDTCLYTFENAPFDTPNDIFCKLNILTNEPQYTSVGTPCYRMWGILDIQIFQKIDTGTGLAEQIADEIAALFKQKTINGVTFRLPVFTKVGIYENFNQINVSLEFSHYEVA